MSDEPWAEYPRVVNVEKTKLSPWVTLTDKHVLRGEEAEIASYHSLMQNDYVTMFVVRVDGLTPIVRQFRPEVERFTYELPSRLLDRDVEPESIAISEIFEETGHKIIGKPQLLCCLDPDIRRLRNRLRTYFAEASADKDADWCPEPGVDLILGVPERTSRHDC